MKDDLCENNIRLRGKKDNILNFISEELVAIAREPTEKEYEDIYMNTDGEFRPVIIEDNWGGQGIMINKDPDTRSYLYFKNSDKQFISLEDDSYGTIFSKGKTRNEDTIFIIHGFSSGKETGDIDAEYFKVSALKHRIDIRVFLWDYGCGKSSVDTFYRNGTTEHHAVHYDDWMWESPMPDYAY